MKTEMVSPCSVGIANKSCYAVHNALKFIAQYTLPNCAHRSGHIPFDVLFSALTRALKDILVCFETNFSSYEVQFLPVLMNAVTGPASDGASFTNGVKFVAGILDENWPCRECFPDETILSHLAKLTGSLHCLRLCTHITLTAAISTDQSAVDNGVKTLERLIPILAKAGALKGQFLHEINVGLLPTFIGSGRETILRLMPIFRLLHKSSDSVEMEQSVKVILGFTSNPTLNNWTFNRSHRGRLQSAYITNCRNAS